MDAGDVKKVTGFTIGGVSPIGLINPIPIVIDGSIFRFEMVWCLAGHPFFVFSISPRRFGIYNQWSGEQQGQYKQ